MSMPVRFRKALGRSEKGSTEDERSVEGALSSFDGIDDDPLEVAAASRFPRRREGTIAVALRTANHW